MAELQKMQNALINAHKSGDTAAATAIANAIKAQRAAPSAGVAPAPSSDQMALDKPTGPYAYRAKQEADKLPERGRLGAAMSSFGQGITFGLADEAEAAMTAIPRMIKDRVGPIEAYKRQDALIDEQRRRGEAKYPLQNIGLQVAGGAATGAAGAGLKLGTVAARALPGAAKVASKVTGVAPRVIPGAASGAGYGALYGVGTAEGGLKERAAGALSGGATGAILGGVAPVVGDKIGKAIGKMKQAKADKAFAAAAPTADDLLAVEGRLFEKARQSGVHVKAGVMDDLIDNITLAGGRRNENLRQRTAGMIDDLQSLKGKPADAQALHEIRQEIGQAMSNADAQDVRSLSKMKNVLDSFIDKAGPKQIGGSREGLDTLRQALGTSAKRFKAQEIEKLLDFADVKTGRYSQSGMVNALRSEASNLYKRIIKGQSKGYTADEIALIRKLAKVETQSKAGKLLSKFAPRGPVSMGVGAIIGASTMGPAGAVVPAVMGAAAARSADKSAIAAAQRLRAMAASGAAPRIIHPLVPKGRFSPLAPGLIAGGSALPAEQ